MATPGAQFANTSYGQYGAQPETQPMNNYRDQNYGNSPGGQGVSVATYQWEKPGRWDDPLKFLPVILVATTISFIGFLYVSLHCIPRLQLGVPPRMLDEGLRQRGIIELILFGVFTTLLVICYVFCICVHPGIIPDGHPHWEYLPQPTAQYGVAAGAPQVTETKKSGERRHCKWCGKYKPDRCHHCRVCNTCILKMDHHCPWIYNCVGFFQLQVFFLVAFLLGDGPALDLLDKPGDCAEGLHGGCRIHDDVPGAFLWVAGFLSRDASHRLLHLPHLADAEVHDDH